MSKTNENVIAHVTAKADEIKAHTDVWLTELEAKIDKAEARTDEGLLWWRKSHWSALIGLGLLIAAMVVGDILGIARLV